MATGIKITNATYGAGSKTVDVTGAVASNINNGNLNLVVTPDSLNVSDPAPGDLKTLHVTYTINGGSSNTKDVQDNEMLMISAPSETRAEGLRITKAEYGYVGNYTDVTKAVQNYVNNGSIDLKVGFKNVGIPDPNPNKQKELRVDYTINGAANTSVLKDGEVFQVSAPNAIAASNTGTPSDTVSSFFSSLFGGAVKGILVFLHVISAYTVADFMAPNTSSVDAVGNIQTVQGANRTMYLVLGLIIPFASYWAIPLYLFGKRLFSSISI